MPAVDDSGEITHVSPEVFLFLRREHRRLSAAVAYWRTLAHHWYLEARDAGRDPAARFIADLMLAEIHRRDHPDLTEEAAPWLTQLHDVDLTPVT